MSRTSLSFLVTMLVKKIFLFFGGSAHMHMHALVPKNNLIHSLKTLYFQKAFLSITENIYIILGLVNPKSNFLRLEENVQNNQKTNNDDNGNDNNNNTPTDQSLFTPSVTYLTSCSSLFFWKKLPSLLAFLCASVA